MIRLDNLSCDENMSKTKELNSPVPPTNAIVVLVLSSVFFILNLKDFYLELQGFV